jgi:hypothetical protein
MILVELSKPAPRRNAMNINNYFLSKSSKKDFLITPKPLNLLDPVVGKLEKQRFFANISN